MGQNITADYVEVALDRLLGALGESGQPWSRCDFRARFDGSDWAMDVAAHDGERELAGWLIPDDTMVLHEVLVRCRRALLYNRQEPWDGLHLVLTRDPERGVTIETEFHYPSQGSSVN